jgi:hypothetical protein
VSSRCADRSENGTSCGVHDFDQRRSLNPSRLSRSCIEEMSSPGLHIRGRFDENGGPERCEDEVVERQIHCSRRQHGRAHCDVDLFRHRFEV